MEELQGLTESICVRVGRLSGVETAWPTEYIVAVYPCFIIIMP